MKILKLSDSYIDKILEVEHASFSAPWTRSMFLEAFQSPVFCCLGAESEDGEFLGFVCFWRILEEIHIGNIAVAPQHRRKGAAKKMLEYLLEEVKGQGVSATLEVRPSNQAAIALYSRFGFVPEGIRPKYYEDGEDALIMWLRNA